MGYYTAFYLLYPADVEEEEIHKALEEINPDYFDTQSYREELLEGYFNAKWYDFEKDIRALSLRFPDKLFVLEGEGEESQDIWKMYFKNGKAQFEKAEFIIGEFDESKLI